MTRLLVAFGVTIAVTSVATAQTPPQRFGFGEPASREAIAGLDI